MKNTPVNAEIVSQKITESGLRDLGKATIREIVSLVNNIQTASGEKFIRMEMGVPGLKPSAIGVEAEIEALRQGVAADYPMLDGIKELKTETSAFIKNFMNVDLAPEGCIPSVGSMQGGYAAFMACGKANPDKDTALFIDPGFPVQKQQYQVLGQKYLSFDVYNFRGDKLYDKLESYLKQGNINCIIYSNPNNPSWICFTEKELEIIGKLATLYDCIVIEDLAYFAMDFRQDMSVPGQPPFQPTVARYTNHYILLISSSKVFSYAGQRIGMLCISNDLYHRKFSGLMNTFGAEEFGYVVVLRIIYALSSGCSHSAQYALAAMFRAANQGKFNFVAEVREYGERAKIMKEMFTRYGFYIVYDKDIDLQLADGFYFTIAYPGMDSGTLLENLLYYGISAISLAGTGSQQQGLRACVSQVQRGQLPILEQRLASFSNHFPANEKK